jgi:cysteine-S-conjugate beta-lyase
MKEETQIIHSVPVDELTGAISVPIYQTSTFVQESPGVNKGYDYARTGNPTRKVLENLIAKLEGGVAGFAFASGLAAIDAVVKLLKSGDEIVAVDDIYGGSYRLFTHIYEKFGIKVHYVDSTQTEEVFNAVNERTRFIWIESPTNPTLKISDLKAIAKIAKAANALFIVDNTFASPALQKPIPLGADIVLHSSTKYLAGHSDLIGGLVVVSTPELAEKIKFIQNSTGAIPGPFDAWLTIRGIETLSLRVEKQSKNAFEAARFLQSLHEVKQVFYPGLATHKNHDIAAEQQSAFGGIVSFTLNENTEESAIRFVTSTQLFKLAESLGGVKSLLCHPASMTHKSIPREKRIHAGIEDSLIRLSFGIEHADDLIDDLKQAIDKVSVTTIQTAEVSA